MALLSFSDVSLYFGSRPIFENLSFQISNKEKIGLVGANGRGKTSLFKLIMEELKPDSGDISILKNIKIGYLPQEIELNINLNALDFVLQSSGNRDKLSNDILILEKKLEASESYAEKEEIGRKLSLLHEELLIMESDFSSHKAEMILLGLGFKETEFKKRVNEFSGGWKMRLKLASLLFTGPDLLLLDEPTNHLDLPSLAWLDNYLSSYKKSFIMISHDRDFLDRHVRRIFAIEPEAFRQYNGNYSHSRTLRSEEEKILINRKKNVEKEKKQLERFVERFKAQANKARQAKSKSKLIKKLEKVETLKEEQYFTFKFPPVERSGDRVVVLDSISKSFGDLHLYKNMNQVIMRRDRIGVVGVNGSGKTTLLKLLAKESNPDSGSVSFGAKVEFSYYAQHQTEALDDDNSILEEVRSVAPSLGETRVRSILGAFLFRGDDVYKSVSVLSGGEKARVALAKILVAPKNLLILDEPTNHLDLESSEALATALEGYDGTLIFVSHNRAWIDKLAEKIWEIDDGKINVFPGNLTEYMGHLEMRREKRLFTKEDFPETSLKQNSKSKISEPEPGLTKVEKRRLEAQKRKKIKEKTGEITKKIKKLENRIEKLESDNNEIQKFLADPEFYGTPDFVEKLKQFRQNEDKLEELMGRWSYQNELYEKAMEELK